MAYSIGSTVSKNKGVFIPQALLSDRNLSLLEKALIIKISDFGDNGCRMSNKTFGGMFGVSEKTAWSAVNALIKSGKIYRDNGHLFLSISSVDITENHVEVTGNDVEVTYVKVTENPVESTDNYVTSTDNPVIVTDEQERLDTNKKDKTPVVRRGDSTGKEIGDLFVKHSPAVKKPAGLTPQQSADFERTWAYSGKRGSKKKARQIYARLNPDTLLGEIIYRYFKQAWLDKWKDMVADGRESYIPHVTTTLNGEDWEEYIPEITESINADAAEAMEA
jgi:hypothetical protein